jgi:hypothetical protein
MKVLVCKITIGIFSFFWVNSIESDSSWELLTDNAKIVLPSNISVNHVKYYEQIKSGDQVKIEVGYDDNLVTIFKGYVTYIKPRIPVEITCEDEMWNLKQNNISDSGRDFTVEKLLKKHFSSYKTDHLNVELGKYYVDNISGAKLLEQLKSDFGLHSFFRGDTLVVGKRYNVDTANHVKFKLDFNTIEDELEYKRKDQIKLKVKAISNNENGSKTEVELGEKNGETRTLNFYNLSTKELKAAAEREMERLLYDGWRGSFKAFGEPLVKHGDIVELLDDNNTTKQGNYWVDEVKYSFGIGGFRQEIKLGAKT